MIITRTETGEYEVVAQDREQRVAGPFPTHAAAWRWIDRHDQEPVSKDEAKWMHLRETNGGAA